MLASAVVPLREPAAVDLRARLAADVKPSEVERLLEEEVTVETRHDPHIDLEAVRVTPGGAPFPGYGDEVVLRVTATPVDDEEGARLADEVVKALAEAGGDGRPVVSST